MRFLPDGQIAEGSCGWPWTGHTGKASRE
jgi:hypothetical protein